MKIFKVFLAVAVCGGLAQADTVTAVNPGSTLANAQVVTGGPAEPALSDVIGTINNDNSQIELFKIYLTGGATFSATTVSNTSNFFDTELFLFDSTGRGVYANNDDLNAGGNQSTLPAGDPLTPLAAGYYYLAITSNGIEPLSSGGTIFDLANNPAFAVLGPNGSGGGDPLSGWQGSSTEVGTAAYDISLTGATVGTPVTTAAPEPSYGLMLLLIGGVALVFFSKLKLPRGSRSSAVAAILALCATRFLGAQQPPQKLGGGLKELMEAHQTNFAARNRSATPAVMTLTKDLTTGQYSTDPKLSNVMTDASGRVLVQIFLDGTVPSADIEQKVTQGNGRVAAVDNVWRHGVVDAYIPLTAVATLESTAGVRSLTLTPKPRLRPMTHTPVTTTPVTPGTQSATGIGPGNTPGNNIQRTDEANVQGYTGAGITVAVTSDSYNANGFAASEISQGLLPAAGVTVINDTSPGSDEGNAMLQLVHDVAPGAKLCFSAADSVSGFANRIRGMRTNAACGADIIADDIGFGDEPFFSDGQVAEAVNEVVTGSTLAGKSAGLAGKNVAYFVYGGNDGNNAFQTTFSGLSNSAARSLDGAKTSQIDATLSGGGFQNFGTAASPSIALPVSFQGFGGTFAGSLTLFWDDLFNDNAVTTDYNLFIVDGAGNIIVSSTADNISSDQPIENISFNNPGDTTLNYFLLISRTSAGSHAANRLLLLSNDNGGTAVSLPAGITGPTVFGHSSAAVANAAAAVTYGQESFAPFHPFMPAYNSTGSVTIAFDGNNNRLPIASVRKKPDMAAIVANSVADFGGQATEPFTGTSAAAPFDAGIAALLLQKAGGPGSLTPAQIHSYMVASGPSRDVDEFTAQASTTGLKVVSKDTIPVFLQIVPAPDPFNTTFTVNFTTAGKSLSSLKIDLTSVGGSLFTDFPFPFKIDSATPGIALTGISSGGSNFNTLTLSFSGFVTGGQVVFDLSAQAPYPSPLTMIYGGFSDLISGAPVTATLSDGTSLHATFANTVGKAWTPYDGYGIVDALTALSKVP